MMKKILTFFIAVVCSTQLLAQQKNYDFIVAKDGTGDFTTIQAAIDSVPDFRKKETTIFIKNGVYKEKIVLPSTKTNVTFVGEDKMKTIITYDDFSSKKNMFGEELGTTGSSGFFLFGDGFTAKNITFRNTAGDVGQAVAIRVDGDRAVFVNCRFIGFQDTLYTHGRDSRQYYKNCYIEGSVDFIFGWSTAYFEGCEIYCKKGGYVTAASTNRVSGYGYVFNHCRFTGSAPENSFYLGRPWRPYAHVVILNSYLGKHIKPEGWHNWGSEEKEKTAFYAEYNNRGPGYSPEKRVEWSYQLTQNQAHEYTLDEVMGDWDPEAELK